MRTKRILTFLIVLILCSVFVAKGVVFANPNGGPTDGSSDKTAEGTTDGSNSSNTDGTSSYDPSGYGHDSCPSGWSVCTGYGATWRYYPWEPGKTEERIQGYGTSWAQGAVITGHDAEVCAQAGGYFRYGMVEPNNNGAQHGVMSFGNNTGAFKSSLFGGGLFYRGPEVQYGGEPFEKVLAAYQNAALIPGNNLSSNTLDANSSTSWFCATYDGTPPPVDPSVPVTPGDPECPGIPVPNGYSSSKAEEGWSSVRTQVRMLNSFGSWTDNLYAKPNDVVQWRHCYFPGMQKVANQKATSVDNQPTAINYSSGANVILPDSQKHYPLTNYQSTVHGIYQWGNIYNVVNRFGESTDLHFNPTDENRGAVRRVDNNYSVTQDWVGSTQSEKTSLDTDALGNANPYHAKASGKAEQHTWSCSWTRTVTIDQNAAVHLPECQEGTGEMYCEGAGAINTGCSAIVANGGGFKDKNSCKSCGGDWLERQKTKSPCTKVQTNTYQCDHGSDQNGWYYPRTVDQNLKAGDKSSETATVMVPYNFDMSAGIKLDGDFVYAGEAASVNSANVTVNARYNSKTVGYYATKALGVKVQVMTFVWDTPVDSVPAGANVRYGQEIPIGDMEAYGSRSYGVNNVNVDDIPAGKYFCVAVQVFPADSGSETAMGSGDFNNTYKRSGADCKPIAKKPSIQIWGGSLFSNGNIETMRSSKTSLLGYAERQYKIYGSTDANVFGSFDELSVMSLGTNENLASGAATADGQGGSFKNIGRFEPTDVGTGFCKYESPLTFANYTSKKAYPICGGVTNTQSGKFGVPAVTTEKISFITSVTDNKDVTANINAGQTIKVGVDVNVITTNTGKNVLYQKGKGALTISETLNLIKGQTYIVHAEGDIDITGDITYEGNYTSMDDVPKVLIYGKNINIHCNVGRIDAAIIADGKIDTCSDSDDINSAANSKQLMINGTIIADSIDLNRTYGASAGKYSSIPAEVVNYDSTLVLWARNKADTGETGVLNTTYIHELAPRY